MKRSFFALVIVLCASGEMADPKPIGEVHGFALLKARLNLMDDQTAIDFYGKVIAQNYFVVRVRLTNNLSASEDSKRHGGSILAFSESAEVAVQYEKRKLTNGKQNKKGVWEAVKEEDLKIFEETPNDNSCDVRVDPRCKGFSTFRPNIQGIPFGIVEYKSPFFPGVEKVWPTLNEANRQNLVAQTMREIEEIPFGSDLTRVLFVPKREFRGLLQGYETRVAQICPYHFNIEVAVVQEKQLVHAVQ